MVRITKKVHDEMVKMRKAGAPYSEIMTALGVSKWSCMKHLKGIEIESNWISEEWQQAENEAEGILIKMGFSHIVNLNQICNIAPFWDYYAEKDKERWLIDVTTNTQKGLVEKQTRGIDGYNLGVLYKNAKQWKLLKLSAEIVNTCSI